MTTGYREHPVDPRLAPYVACYWMLDVAGDAGAHPVMPDGCIDLLFDSRTESLSAVGTMTRALWTESCGPTQFVGVRFKPGGAVPFVRDRADLLTDDIVEADSVLGSAGSRWKRQLLERRFLDERVGLLEHFLLARLQADVAVVDSRVAWASCKLLDDPGYRIDLLARELGVSRQYVRRLFLQHTGLTPKAFARVARLGELLRALQTGVSLTDAAFASGYTDQAHMSREFRSLVGITPATHQNQGGSSIRTRSARRRGA